jgi:hypothetical protein
MYSLSFGFKMQVVVVLQLTLLSPGLVFVFDFNHFINYLIIIKTYLFVCCAMCQATFLPLPVLIHFLFTISLEILALVIPICK